MPFKNSEDEAEDIDLTADLTLEEKELEFDEGFTEDVSFSELDQLAKKGKMQGGRFSLKARRAIEDHLEQRRLRKEMDYLFNDDFAKEDE